VADPGPRLVRRPEPPLPQGEAQVDVLAVAERVRRIEPTDLEEHRAAHQQARRRPVVHVAAEAVLELLGIVAVAQCPRRTVAADHAAGLLQDPVEVQQARDHGACPGIGVQDLDQGGQPSLLDERVAVEDADVPPDGMQHALVGPRAKADVAIVEEQPGPLDAAEHVLDPVARGVVDHDQLERGVGVGDEGLDRRLHPLLAAVGHHHHRHQGVGGGGYRELLH
jgi:hypothetical protein